MNLSTLIALRYLRHKQKDSSIAFMIKMCFAGIVIGTFALMLTLIITNGFEKVISEKMQGINAQLILTCPGHKLDYEKISNVLEKEFGWAIKGIGCNAMKQAILDDTHQQTVLFLKGIDPETEPNVTNLPEKITLPQNANFEKLLEPGNIIVGYKTALNHNLKVGQEITLLIPEPSGKRHLKLTKNTVTIAGIFNIGLEEYDNNLAFLSLETLNDLFAEQGCDQISLSLKPNPLTTFTPSLHAGTLQWWQERARYVAHRIKQLFNGHDYERQVITLLHARMPHLTIQSWKDLYPALVESLYLEKIVGFLILFLISLVACMNMISLLFMQIQHKRRDIAIFNAMGLSGKQIRSIFLKMGMIITISASLAGLTLAFIAGYMLEHYPFIKIPDVYFVSYVPARMEAEIFLVVFVATVLLGFLATWLPAKRSSQLNIANILRQD